MNKGCLRTDCQTKYLDIQQSEEICKKWIFGICFFHYLLLQIRSYGGQNTRNAKNVVVHKIFVKETEEKRTITRSRLRSVKDVQSGERKGAVAGSCGHSKKLQDNIVRKLLTG